MAENKQQQEIKEITEKLEQGVQELFESEKYKEFLHTMAKFHNYSLNNTLLIAMQKPDATLVAGYNAWLKDHERHVLKGEKGIRIFAPAPYKVKEERELIDPITQKPVLDANNNPVKEVVEVKKPAFKLVSVFDVSQTDGKEIPGFDIDELLGDVEDYVYFFDALKRSSPVPVDFEKIEGGARGYYHQEEKRIAINEGMSEVQNVKTLVHEMAHQKLHDVENMDKELKLSRGAKEVEAESIAYVICQHYGIDTEDYSFSYVAGWSEGKETPELKASLDRIRKASNEMINEIDSHIAEINLELQAENDAFMTCYLKISDSKSSEYRLNRIAGTQEEIEAVLKEIQEAGKTDSPITEIEKYLDEKGIPVLPLGDNSNGDPFSMINPEYEYDIDTNEIYRVGAALGQETSREEKALRLAASMDQMAYDTDLYEYRDNIEDREEFVKGLQQDLLSGSEAVDGMKAWFQELIDDETNEAEEAQKIIDEINEFQSDVLPDNSMQEAEQPKEEIVGMVDFANGEHIEYSDKEKYLNCIKEEIEYASTSGFHFTTLSQDPELQKAVQDEVYNIYGEKNPHDVSYYEKKESITEPTISFYVAECMEYTGLGEYHEGLTLKEAFDIYEKIPAERMNGGKGIGFDLQDGSFYAGTFDLMQGNIVQDETINMITHYRNSALVQQAIKECREELNQRMGERESGIEAGAYYVGEDKYLSMQSASDGSWDYTLYDKDFKEIDGGQIGDASMSFAEARNEILMSFDLMQEHIRNINPEELENKVRFHEALQLHEQGYMMDDGVLRSEISVRIEEAMGIAYVERDQFSEAQMDIIKDAATKDVALTELLNPEFPVEQMKFILENMEHGYDVEKIYVGGKTVSLVDHPMTPDEIDGMQKQIQYDAIPKMLYSDKQWKEIENGMKHQIDVSLFTNPDFSAEQMKEIRIGLDKGIDVSAFANLDFTDKQMREIRRGIEAGFDVSSYAKPELSVSDMRKAFFAEKDGASALDKQLATPEPDKDTGLYRYYSTQRPVAPGTYPGKPKEIQNFDNREKVCDGRMEAWGYLDYEKPLTEKQMTDYELKPALQEAVAQKQSSFSLPKEKTDKEAGKPRKKQSVMENLRKKQAQIANAEKKNTKIHEKGARE